MRSRPDLIVLLALLVVLLGFAGLTALNLAWGPQMPGGGELVPAYSAARVYLQGASPYGIGAARYTEQIAEMVGVGRVAQFNGPFFVLLPFLPLSLLKDFNLARAIWTVFLEVSAVGVVFLSLYILNWRLPLWRYALLALFALGWVHTVPPLVQGDASLLSAALLLLVIPVLQARRFRLAVVLLAVSALRPFTAPLLLVFLLLRAIARSKGRVLRDILLIYGVLTALASLLRPSWLLEWGQLLIGRGEWGVPTGSWSVLTAWFPVGGDIVFYVLAAVSAIMIAIAWLHAIGKDHQAYLWAAMVTIALTPLTGMPVLQGGYILMLAPLTLVFMIWERRWTHAGYWLTFANQLVLFAGLWALLIAWGGPGLRSLPDAFLLILPLYLIITLTWGRWWALEPSRLPYEQMRRTLEEL